MKEKTSQKTAKHPPCRTSAQGIRIFCHAVAKNCHAFRKNNHPINSNLNPQKTKLMGDETETAATAAFMLSADTNDHNAW